MATKSSAARVAIPPTVYGVERRLTGLVSDSCQAQAQRRADPCNPGLEATDYALRCIRLRRPGGMAPDHPARRCQWRIYVIIFWADCPIIFAWLLREP